MGLLVSSVFRCCQLTGAARPLKAVLRPGFAVAGHTLGIGNLYFYRTFPVVVPGEMFNTVLLGLLIVTLAIAWWSSRRDAPSPA